MQFELELNLGPDKTVWSGSWCGSYFSYLVLALGYMRPGLGFRWLCISKEGEGQVGFGVSTWFAIGVWIRAGPGALLNSGKHTGGDPPSEGCAVTQFSCPLESDPQSWHAILS